MAGIAILMMLFPLVFFVAIVVGYIVFLVAAWRLMKAHESTADSARRAVAELQVQREA